MATTGHFYSQRILLALGVLGERGGVLGCIQVVVHGRNISSGTAPAMESDSSLEFIISLSQGYHLQLHYIFIFEE